MDKNFNAAEWEPKIVKKWNDEGTFVATVDESKDSFCIVLPPPNANGSLHAGHVMMVYQDIMCRYARIQGKNVLYLPGTDHAGFETQFVFEKTLAKQDKSRFDYDRETLYHMIENFVATSQGQMKSQLQGMGFSLDWSHERYTLDPKIIQIVHQTFKKLFDAGLIYRADRLVNYCCRDGTSFSDLEVESKEVEGLLYHIKFPVVSKDSRVWSLNFRDPSVVDLILTGKKTIETRVLNPDEPDRYFGDIKAGDVIIVKDLERKMNYLYDVKRATTYKALGDYIDKEDLNAVLGGREIERTESALIEFYDSLSPSYGQKAKANGLIALEIQPLVTKEYITVATTRPETMLGDVGVMVNPEDKRYTHLVGSQVILPLTDRTIPIIADSYVDMAFGTGAVKVTPAHDFNDFEIAKRHKLNHPPVVGFDGRMMNTNTKYDRMKVKPAREAVIADLTSLGYLVKTQAHPMVLKTCYKCGSTLEPLPLPQWYIKVRPLADRAKELMTSGEIKVYPERFHKILVDILDNYIDWNISRQIVWGIRIPAFQNKTTGDWLVETDTEAQKKLIEGGEWRQDEDTFDTWFSSGQWPFATVESISQEFANYFYPTSVLETGYDIARAWVARMMMLGAFVTDKPPFTSVVLHGMVRDKKGQKMSKSKGNVINPLELTTKYGTDALRTALVFETALGNDVNLSEEKVRGMRNFVNKVWNIARFIQSIPTTGDENIKLETTDTIAKLQEEYKILETAYAKAMADYEFPHALGLVYEFVWHRFADFYIEQLKDEARAGTMQTRENLAQVFAGCMTMLEPFAPFVVEAVREQTVQK